MDWGQSYRTSWRVFKVNRDTWADAERMENIDSVELTRTADGDLLESGSMEVVGDLSTDYYRVVMTAEQDASVERIDVATLLMNTTGGKFDYRTTVQSAEGYSVLYPASKTLLHTGAYAPAGVDGAAYVKKLLEDTINAPVEIEGSFTLNDHVVHEVGSSVLEAAWAVLNAGPDGGFVIQIDGRGVVHIKPKPTEPELTLDSTNMKLLANGIEYNADTSEIPNRYIVINGSSKTVAVNDDPASSVSTVNRGFYVDVIDESPEPVNGETMTAYATRKLREASKLEDENTYTREFVPDVYLYDIVRASIDGLEGDLRIQSQSVSCGYGITIQEKANREIYLW